jgi:hypothetical protein
MRFGAVVARLRQDRARVLLTGYIMQVLDANRTKCLLVEDALGKSRREERQAGEKAHNKAAMKGAHRAVARTRLCGDGVLYGGTLPACSGYCMHILPFGPITTCDGDTVLFYLDVL